SDHADLINTPSTSESCRVLNLRVDDDTMSNLHSFYQNNTAQHDFCPKMTKHRKYRVCNYEHLIGNTNDITFSYATFIAFVISIQLKNNFDLRPTRMTLRQ